MAHYLFLVASARVQPAVGNTEHLARRAASQLAPAVQQTWLHLSAMTMPPFVDQRHSVGTYPPPTGDAARLLEATLACTHLVLVSPLYWYSYPSALKTCLDHWSGWMRVPGLEFKDRMAGKTLYLVTTSGSREKAQPMFDTTALVADFMSMRFAGPLWGKGGPPGAVEGDADALARAAAYLSSAA